MRDDALTRSSFSAKGLQHEDVLTDFFIGNFADIPYDRGSAGFSALFQQYLEAYARHCGASLPVSNRVEMTRQVCADPPRLPGLPPPSPGTDSCSAWRTVSLGYADPSLYAAKSELDKEQLANHVKDGLGLNAKSLRDFIGSAKDVVQLTSPGTRARVIAGKERGGYPDGSEHWRQLRSAVQWSCQAR